MEINSCTDKEDQGIASLQVQGPLPTPLVHSHRQGFREGREVETIITTQYVLSGQFSIERPLPTPVPSSAWISVLTLYLSPHHHRDPKEEC